MCLRRKSSRSSSREVKRGLSFLHTLLLLTLLPRLSIADTYQDASSLFRTVLHNSHYNKNVRPLLDQKDVMYVHIAFEIFSILEVSDVDQSFKCNGMMGMAWEDEILRWNESDFGGISQMSPSIKDVFKPRVVLLNTRGRRDLFEDNFSPVIILSNGLTAWGPGSIFPVYCKMDFTYYPFDEQICHINMVLMNFYSNELQFVPLQGEVRQNFYVENEEWKLQKSKISTGFTEVLEANFSSLSVSFTLKRNPEFLVVSILLPIVFLSLLQLLIFLIPVESGEKVTFGITVLLSLVVFMSIILSGMLPRTSGTLPLIVSYMMGLLFISVLAMVNSIIIVWLYHRKKERAEKPKEDFHTFKFPFIKLVNSRHASFALGNGVTPHLTAMPHHDHAHDHHHQQQQQQQQQQQAHHMDSNTSISSSSSSSTPPEDDTRRQLVKRLDMASLLVFGAAWVGLTVWYLVQAN